MNQDAIDLLVTYRVHNSRVTFPAIRLLAKNLETIRVVLDDHAVDLLGDNCLIETPALKGSKVPIGSWLVFTEVGAFVILPDEDFRKRFEAEETDPRSLMERFTELQEGLHHRLQEMINEGLIAEDSDDEALYELLVDQIQSVGKPGIMKDLAVVALTLHLNAKYMPGELIAAHLDEDLPQ